MANVIAKARGYLGGILREAGEVFGIDDELWADEKRRPKWCTEVGAQDAPDEGDGDGPEGGETEGDGDGLDDAVGRKPKGKGGRKPKPETVSVPQSEPFADAPPPVRVKNEINDATGGTQPDWIAPSGAPKAVAD
jgi:hypothetical protein